MSVKKEQKETKVESAEVKRQLKVRWSWILPGILLLLFGLVLPFALNFYYSSSLSQETGEKPENIILESTPETKSAKTDYQQQILQGEIIDLTQTGKFALFLENDAKHFSLEKRTRTVSAHQTNALFLSASETNNLEISKTQSFLSSKIAAIPQQTPERKIGINKGVTEIQKKKVDIKKVDTRVQKPPVIPQQPEREPTRILFLPCPEGKVPTDSACGSNMQTTFANATIRPPLPHCVNQTSPTTLDFNKCGKNDYEVRFVRNFRPVKATVTVKECSNCVTQPPPITETPTPESPTPPTNTQTPPILPTISPSPTSANNIKANTNKRKPTPSPNKPDTNNNNANNNGELNDYKDKFSYVYPSRFIRGAVYTIILSLKPISNTSAMTGNCISSGKTRHGADVAVKLEKTAGLEIIEASQERCFYDRNALPGDFPLWKWKVKLSDTIENPEEVVLKFNYDIEQKSAGKSQFLRGDLNTNKVTRGNILVNRPVGLPFLAKIVAFFSSTVGGLAFIFGFVPTWWRKSEEDEVHCTVFAPPEVKAGSNFLVQVFAHLQEQAESLAEIAQATDESLKEQTVRKLSKFIERGSKLTFQLLMSNVEIDEPVQNQTWEGSIIEVPFIIAVPKDCESGLKFGKIIISENDVPIGRLTFKFNISDNAETSPISEKVSRENFKRYQMAFISYASENRLQVLERVQMLEAAKIKYFQDVLSLSPGERWEKSLYKHIDESDVVFLFWSNAASQSKWVEKEILYAFERQGGNETSPPDIIPIILEGPPPVEPPPALNFLHFNDKFIYFMYAAEAEKEARKKKPN